MLRLLPTALTPREIADELFVSLNTVKSHTRTLYRKLGVRNRHAAIEQGAPASCCEPANSYCRVRTVHPPCHHDGGHGDPISDQVQGRLPEGVAREFPTMTVRAGKRLTTVCGPLPDTAALYGLISRLEALGLVLVTVRSLPDDEGRGDQKGA